MLIFDKINVKIFETDIPIICKENCFDKWVSLVYYCMVFYYYKEQDANAIIKLYDAA